MSEHMEDLYQALLKKLDSLADDYQEERNFEIKGELFKRGQEIAKLLKISDEEVHRKFGRVFNPLEEKWAQELLKTGKSEGLMQAIGSMLENLKSAQARPIFDAVKGPQNPRVEAAKEALLRDAGLK